MELLRNLFEGYPNLWGGGVAHSVLILSLVLSLIHIFLFFILPDVEGLFHGLVAQEGDDEGMFTRSDLQ